MIKPVKFMMESKYHTINCFGNYLAYLWQYRSIYKMNVKTEFKGRFKYTVLGYFWHLLTPLTQIVIYLLIFTVIFGRDIPYYWAYISTGMFAFNYFITCSAGASTAIVQKANMVTKMAMAREIIVFSKVTTNLITMVISYSILAILILFFGQGLTINFLYLLVIIPCLTMFNTGLALFFSSITVYVRDVSNIITLIFGCMMFALPIMYMANTRSTTMMELFWQINPLYYYIETIHDSFYWGIMPDSFQLLMCFIFGIVSLIVGLFVFKKLERGFAERL